MWRHVLKPELLDAMKRCLRDLENTSLLSPDDLNLVSQKGILRQQISALEKEDSDGCEKILTAAIDDNGKTLTRLRV